MKKVICFGEIMGRLNPPGYLRFSQTDSFEISYCGAEANVAVSLANFGIGTAYVTKLPQNDIAMCAVRELNKYKVDTGFIQTGGERMGMYYVEKGASLRPSKVIYDRKYSSISMADTNDFDWEKILEDASWFHFTGITPALGGNLPQICLQAVKTAKGKGVPVSCDINYRKTLWSREKASQTMSDLMPFVNVCIANEEDAWDVFGIRDGKSDVSGGKISKEGYEEVARKMQEKFGFEKVAITLRESISASDNNWGGLLLDGKETYLSDTYKIHIVDRVGGGDSFGAGLIYSFLSGFGSRESLDFAVAASALKQTVEHDFNQVSADEVRKLMDGDKSGRVQR